LGTREFKECTIREVDGAFTILTNVKMDNELPMIGEIIKAGGKFWKVKGIHFHVGSEEGDIGLRVNEYILKIE